MSDLKCLEQSEECSAQMFKFIYIYFTHAVQSVLSEQVLRVVLYNKSEELRGLLYEKIFQKSLRVKKNISRFLIASVRITRVKTI